MRTFSLLLSLALLLTACSFFQGGHHGAAATLPKDTARGSVPYEVRTQVGKADVRINYYSPAVRGRIVWGGLVPYDAVWVTGAHSATSLEVNRDFEVGGQSIKAGKYAIFTIPGRDEWTVIINKRWNQHLADDYKESEDLVRIKATPQATEGITERLRYGVEKTGNNAANIVIRWEKLQVPFALKIL